MHEARTSSGPWKQMVALKRPRYLPPAGALFLRFAFSHFPAISTVPKERFFKGHSSVYLRPLSSSPTHECA